MSYGPKPLSSRQIKFCREYLKDFSASEAARRAGYTHKCAARAGYQLTHNPRIQKHLKECAKETVEKQRITVDQVLAELKSIAFVDSTLFAPKYVNDRVIPPDVHALAPEIRAAIAEVQISKRGIIVKSYDKVRALELLGKYLAMFIDRTEHSLTPDTPLVVVLPPAKGQNVLPAPRGEELRLETGRLLPAADKKKEGE